MNAMDIFDDIVGPFNFIDWLQGKIVAMLRGERGVRFTILRPDKGGEHGRTDCVAILKKYHVQTFGHMHDAKHLHFNVGERQTDWAASLLMKAGVDLIAPRNRGQALKRMPPAWDDQPDTGSRRKPKRKRQRRQRGSRR